MDVQGDLKFQPLISDSAGLQHEEYTLYTKCRVKMETSEKGKSGGISDQKITIVIGSRPVYRDPQVIMTDELSIIDRAVKKAAERGTGNPVTITKDEFAG